MKAPQTENTNIPTPKTTQDKFLELLAVAANGKLAISIPMMAEILSISRTTAYALVRSEGFPSFAIGTRTRISLPGLIDWVERASTGKAS